jgi:hypothetical protein
VITLSKLSRIGACLALFVVCAPAVARAQTYVVPYIGWNIGGDADCSATGCASRSVTLGGA